MEIKQTNTHDTAPDTYPLEKNPQNTATESSEGAKQKGFPLWIKIGLALLLLILLGTAFYFFYPDGVKIFPACKIREDL